jgi:signal transduction histidine kinase
MLNRIRKSFSTKLSIGILLMAITIFVVSLGVLFTQSRHFIRSEAIGRANAVLNTTMQRLSRNLMTIENATNAYTWMIEQSFEPEKILGYTNMIVRLNPHIDGCSISAEPDMFKKYGKHFSAYTVRETDTIRTVIEEPYDYFNKIWYKSPRNLNAGCWEVYTDEVDSLELTLDGMIASYGKPLYSADSSIVGIISTDLSFLRLSKVMSEVKPYPNSYFMMINEDGRFFIHPDSTKLFTQTIFSNIGEQVHRQIDVIALGHEMTSGKKGHMLAHIDNQPCLVCYQPVAGTKWSLAIVCPDSDVLAGYNRLTYIVVPLLAIGLIIIILLCHRAVTHTIRPLNQLLDKTQAIASGNMEIHISKSQREDVIGQLQNSFAAMLQSLNFHMGSVRFTTEQTRLQNEELEKATNMAKEADKQKTIFIQNVSHQIRTPLNIIMGFAQVLSDISNEGLSDEEMKSITAMMDHNSKLLNRMLLMLFDSSDTGLTEELNAQKSDMVQCNDVAHEAIAYTNLHYPKMKVNFESDVDDNFCIQASQLYLMRALRELLYNSAKYSDGENIKLQIKRTDNMIRFVVEDTGKSITEADSDTIFKFFVKVDDLTEGLGLGLPLAKRHAQNLGGDLILDTDYQEGCRFIIEIPC